MGSAVELAQENIDYMLKGIIIPSPPQIIADLQMEMAMPDPDLSDIASLINKDAALAGSVLKVINSPFYSTHSISSIQQAVMMLGMNTIANLVNAVQLREMNVYADDMTDENQLVFNRFWDSAEDVAKCCMLIAKRLSFLDSDIAYMLGLFHNIGIPLLIHKYPNYLSVITESYQTTDSRVIDVENNEFNTNHAVIGYYVARSWKLPEIIGQIISEHHNCHHIFTNKSDTTSEKIAYIAVLKMAEHIAGLHNVLGDQETDFEWQTICNDVLDCLRFSESDYEEISCDAQELGVGNLPV